MTNGDDVVASHDDDKDSNNAWANNIERTDGDNDKRTPVER